MISLYIDKLVLTIQTKPILPEGWREWETLRENDPSDLQRVPGPAQRVSIDYAHVRLCIVS